MTKNNIDKIKKNAGWDHPILREIYKAIGFVIILLIAASLFLKIVTRHNQELSVPDFSGLTLDEAHRIAKRHKLKVEVSDSVFIPSVSRGIVLKQNPKAGNMVKKNRRILLTINTIQPKLVTMPSVTGFSLRQALAELEAKQLSVGRLTYVYDMATDNVLSQKFNGRFIAPGTKIEAGSQIDLELGNNGESGTSIPDVTGVSLQLAKEILLENSLNLGKIHYDNLVKSYSDSVSSVVIRQIPSPTRVTSYPLGTEVELFLSIDKEKSKAIKTE